MMHNLYQNWKKASYKWINYLFIFYIYYYYYYLTLFKIKIKSYKKLINLLFIFYIFLINLFSFFLISKFKYELRYIVRDSKYWNRRIMTCLYISSNIDILNKKNRY